MKIGELAIADNIAYVKAVLGEVTGGAGGRPRRLVLCGFSQGTAMAYRTAAFSGYRVDGLIILAGDLPPRRRPGCRDPAPSPARTRRR